VAHAAHAAQINAAALVASQSLSSGSSGQTTLQQMGVSASPSSKEDQLRFAKACIAHAEQMLHDTPNIGTIYGGVCADANGKTPERVVLEKALLQRGIRVVRWDVDMDSRHRPLLFPPHWADRAEKEGGFEGLSTTVLLDFSQR